MNMLTESKPIVNVVNGERAARLSYICGLIQRRFDRGVKGIYLFGALKSIGKNKFNSTNIIDNIISKCKDKDNLGKVLGLFLELEEFHLTVIQKEFVGDEQISESICQECRIIFGEYRKILVGHLLMEPYKKPDKTNNYIISDGKNAFSFKGLGDVIASRLYAAILSNKEVEVFDMSSLISDTTREFRNRASILIGKGPNVMIVPEYIGLRSGMKSKSLGGCATPKKSKARKLDKKAHQPNIGANGREGPRIVQ